MSLATRVLEAMMENDYVAPAPVMFAMFQCLEAIDDIDDPIVTRKLLECFEGFYSYIPSQYNFHRDDFLQIATDQGFQPSDNKQPSVPLYEILTDCGKAIMDLVGPIFNKEIVAKGYFPELRKQLLDNENAASGISQVDRILGRKDVIGSDEYDGEPEELIRLYLRHTPFYQLLYTQVPFVIPRKTFASHGIILAPPNHGKTQLLGALIAQSLKEETGIFVLDPHGDLFNILRTRVAPNRCIILDPDTNPPPLNFLDFGTSTEAQTLQTFSYLMSALVGGLSPKQQNIVPYLLKLLRKVDNPSIETLAHIVGDKSKSVDKSPYSAAIRELDKTDQLFFDTVWFSGMAETKEALNWRLLGALSSETFRQMFSARYNSFNPDAAIRDRKVVLVKGGRNSLGDFGMEVFLQFIITQYFAAGLRRASIPSEKRHLCIMFVDEAHTVLKSKTINDILVELRKFQCAFVAATQVWHQVGEEVKAAVLGATAIRAVGPVSHSDAVVLSREMGLGTTPEFIRSMKAQERSHADWAFYVSGMTDRAVKVRVPYGVLESLPQVPVADVATIQVREFLLEERQTVAAPQPGSAAIASQPFIKPGKDWD